MSDPPTDQLRPGEQILFRLANTAKPAMKQLWYALLALAILGVIILSSWPLLFDKPPPLTSLLPGMLVATVFVVASTRKRASSEIAITDQRLLYRSGRHREDIALSQLATVQLTGLGSGRHVVLGLSDGQTTPLQFLDDPEEVEAALVEHASLKVIKDDPGRVKQLLLLQYLHILANITSLLVGLFLGVAGGALCFIVPLGNSALGGSVAALVLGLPMTAALALALAVVGIHVGNSLAWRFMWRHVPAAEVPRFFPVHHSDQPFRFMNRFWRYFMKNQERYLTRLYGTRIKLVRE